MSKVQSLKFVHTFYINKNHILKRAPIRRFPSPKRKRVSDRITAEQWTGAGAGAEQWPGTPLSLTRH